MLIEWHSSFLMFSEVVNPENITRKCIKEIAGCFSKVQQSKSLFLSEYDVCWCRCGFKNKYFQRSWMLRFSFA